MAGTSSPRRAVRQGSPGTAHASRRSLLSTGRVVSQPHPRNNCGLPERLVSQAPGVNGLHVGGVEPPPQTGLTSNSAVRPYDTEAQRAGWVTHKSGAVKGPGGESPRAYPTPIPVIYRRDVTRTSPASAVGTTTGRPTRSRASFDANERFFASMRIEACLRR